MTPNNPPKWIAWCFASSILVGAFLVFQVQPVISKTILPWFGGSPAVWTTCMLFFQVLLFGGYLYAHLSAKYLTPAWQGTVHALLVLAAVMLLPIMPDANWKPIDSAHPTWRILLLLGANVGLPYFLLSSTAPLIQSWFSQTFEGKSPYRLYALSNAGSLVALLSYPFLFEPAMGVQSQAAFWTLGFCVFAIFCGLTALYFRRQQSIQDVVRDDTSTNIQAPSFSRYSLWLILPAFASVMLLATTNHICQDVAVIPFLWVAPLSLYLLTFIICFDNQKWYSRRWCSLGALASIVMITVMILNFEDANLIFEVGVYLAAMFFICMLCHGELVHRKPEPKWLTGFYLMSSAGGAVGGILVAVICPLVFSSFFELVLVIVGGYFLAAGMFLSASWNSWLSFNRVLKPAACILTVVGMFWVLRSQSSQIAPGIFESKRNFYGVLTVTEMGANNPENHRRMLFYGRITHGYQLMGDGKRGIPTAYYGHSSGVGVTLQNLSSDQPRRIGVIGLGVGTVAAYAKAEDYYRFYEINPDVYELAQDHFTYLEDCPAEFDVILGDARLSMEQESPQQFDVLVVDAFSGDAVPAHLLTVEAMSIYRKHVKPGGVIAVHISNRHIDLFPVVTALANHDELQWTQIVDAGDKQAGTIASQWMLLSSNSEFMELEIVQSSSKQRSTQFKPILWTDEYSNMVSLLK